MTDLLADLRRGLPLLVVATLAGAAIAGGLALREGGLRVSTARLLLASRGPEPRETPIRPEDLEALVEPALLASAAEASGVDRATLAGAFEIAQGPTSGLYDLSVSLRDGETARKAADVLARDLVALLLDLRARKLEFARASLAPPVARARKAREEAETAYLSNLDAGRVEAAKAAQDRSASVAAAAALGHATAERERLRFAFERAVQEERWSLDAQTRTGLEVEAREPQAAVWVEAGPAVHRPRSLLKAALSGGALAFAIAFAGLLALRELRRSPPAEVS